MPSMAKTTAPLEFLVSKGAVFMFNYEQKL